MRTPLCNQAHFAAWRSVQGQVLAKQRDGKDWLSHQLGQCGDRMPVSAQERAHRCAEPNLRQAFIGFSGEHHLIVASDSRSHYDGLGKGRISMRNSASSVATALVVVLTVACAPPVVPSPTAPAVPTNAPLTKVTASYSERVGNY